MNHKNCLICNSNNIIPLTGYEIHQLGKCNDCGFVFMLRIPTTEELDKHYSSYSYKDEQYLSPLTIKSYNDTLDYLEGYRKTNNILDVGCGMGWLMDEAIKRGWNAYGTEYSPTAVEICRKKGIKMTEGVLNPATFGDIKFDVIVSFEVIEHINNPRSELKNINSLLRENGLFYMTTPNFNCYLRYKLKDKYNVITYPEHLSYYTKKTMNKALNDAGFRKKELLTTGISLTRQAMSMGEKTSPVGEKTSDEKLRKIMSSNILMKLLKSIVNRILTITGFGMTLKAYYEKN